MPRLRALCRHCNRKPVNRPRSLCWGCYGRRGVRDLYPAETNQHGAARGVGLSTGPGQRCEPTPVPPGPERVAILAARAAAGQELHHAADARRGLG